MIIEDLTDGVIGVENSTRWRDILFIACLTEIVDRDNYGQLFQVMSLGSNLLNINYTCC